VEAALHESPDEARPGRALVVARRQLEAQHAPLAGHGDTRGDQRRHRHHATVLTHLEVGGIEPEIREAALGQRATAERLHLGIE
jgi:hypothetical protein